MKKSLLIFGGIALMATNLNMNAQLRVRGNGNVQIGVANINTSGTIIHSQSQTLANTYQTPSDSVATLTLFGTRINGYGANLALGNGHNVGVRDTNRRLELYANNGFLLSCGSDTVMKFDNSASSRSFDFKYDVKAKGVLLYSDARLKKDIEELRGESEGLAELSPVKFRFGKPEGGKVSALSQEGNNNAFEDDNILRYGFLAQDVQEVYPELVREDAEGNLGIDYIGFIPLLVDRINELQATVNDQQKIIESLTEENQIRRIAPDQNVTAAIDENLGEIVTAKLYQNRPNPFKENTVIRCDVPQSASEAALYVYDLQGKQIMKLAVEGRGAASVEINGSSLAAGMYVYALVVDGEAVDSRRMILTD